MLDPTKHRLHDRFAPPIVRLTLGTGQPLGHAYRSRILIWVNRRLLLSLAPQRHQYFHLLMLFQFRKGVLRAKTRIAQHSFGQLAEVLLDRFHHRYQLLVVGCVVAEPDRYNQLTVGIHHRLGVVALLKTPAQLHDARLGISEVILCFVLGHPEGPLERSPSSIPTALLVIGVAPLLPIRLGLALFHTRLSRLNLGQATLPSFELLRQLFFSLIRSPLRVLLSIDQSRTLQQCFDLFFEFLLLFLHSPVAHRFVLARVRLDFGPIQSNGSKLYQSQLSGQPRHRDKQFLEFGQMPHPKLTDRSVRREISCPQNPKRHILIKLSGQLARREYSRRIPVHQYLHQQRWIVRLITPPVSFVARIKLLQIQPIDDLAYEIHQMIFAQPLRRRGRQQKRLIRLVRKKGCRHDHLTLSTTFLFLIRASQSEARKFFCGANS